MSQISYHQRHAWMSALDDLDVDGTGDTYEWVGIGVPVEVMRVGMTYSVALANAASTVSATLIHRPTIGATAGQTTADTWVMTGTTTIAAGAGSYRDVIRQTAASTAADASTVNVGPSGGIILLPGESLLFTMVTDADTGAGYLWIEYLILPFAGTTNLNGFTKDVT